MLDVRLRYLGNGQFQATNKPDSDAIAAALNQGDVVRAQVTSPRTTNQNRLLHALCEAAWDNLPERDPTPTRHEVPTWRHMKSWLLIRAGHCDVAQFAAGSFSKAAASALRYRFDTVHFALEPHTNTILMKTARSTKGLIKEDMGELIDRVMAIIGTTVVPGVDPMSLFEQAKQRAA